MKQKTPFFVVSCEKEHKYARRQASILGPRGYEPRALPSELHRGRVLI